MARKPQTIEDKYALGGIVVGVLTAAVIAFVFAFESTTIVRYFIMASGLVLGWLIGRTIGRMKTKSE